MVKSFVALTVKKGFSRRTKGISTVDTTAPKRKENRKILCGN
jgi:hypothetical protein